MSGRPAHLIGPEEAHARSRRIAAEKLAAWRQRYLPRRIRQAEREVARAIERGWSGKLVYVDVRVHEDVRQHFRKLGFKAEVVERAPQRLEFMRAGEIAVEVSW